MHVCNQCWCTAVCVCVCSSSSGLWKINNKQFFAKVGDGKWESFKVFLVFPWLSAKKVVLLWKLRRLLSDGKSWAQSTTTAAQWMARTFTWLWFIWVHSSCHHCHLAHFRFCLLFRINQYFLLFCDHIMFFSFASKQQMKYCHKASSGAVEGKRCWGNNGFPTFSNFVLLFWCRQIIVSSQCWS